MERENTELEELTGKVTGCAMAVHRELGSGFLEPVYHQALSLELTTQRISHSLEEPLKVLYKETIVGKFSADILVENRLPLKLKAVTQIISKHEVQLVNYLTATGIDTGLLFNFGAESLQFKKKYRIYRQSLSGKTNPAKSC